MENQDKKDQSALAQLEDDYYLGGYQSCINKASSMPKSREATYYMCLSYFYLRKFDILKLEASKSQDTCVRLIQEQLVTYSEDESRRKSVLETLRSQLQSGQIEPKDDLSRLVVASIFVQEKLYAEALKCLDPPSTLPVMLARTSIYHQMNRVDLAEREVAKMAKINKYNTLTLLAAIPTATKPGDRWVEPDLGKAQELEAIYKPTPFIKNIQTAAAISAGNYDLAKQYCQAALDLDSDNVEALINMGHILAKTGAPTQVKERYSGRLKTLNPDHELVRELERIDRELTELAA